MYKIKNSDNQVISAHIERAYRASMEGDRVAFAWLHAFFEDYRNIEERHPVSCQEKNGYLGYIGFLWPFSKAMAVKDYPKACNELHKMAFFIDLLQEKVYYSLVQILSESLGDSSESENIGATTSGKQEFLNAMALLDTRYITDRPAEEKRMYFQFLFDTIKTDLAVSPERTLLTNPDAPSFELNPFPDMHPSSLEEIGLILPEKVEVDMAKASVVSYVYDHEKLSGAVSDISRSGFTDDGNCDGIYIEELDLAFVTNGFHHASAAGIQKTGKFLANKLDFARLMARYKSDGEYWRRISDGAIAYPVRDFRISVLCEFYRFWKMGK